MSLFFLKILKNFIAYIYICLLFVFTNWQINYNGHITFGARHGSFDPTTAAPSRLAAGVTAMFNVFFSDNDLRRPNGQMYYRFSNVAADLSKANNLIRGRGFTTFSASYCLVATWEKVRFYVANENDRSKPETQPENTYQEILCTDGNDGHVIYQYQDMQWTRSQDPTTEFATVNTFSLIFRIHSDFSISQQHDCRGRESIIVNLFHNFRWDGSCLQHLAILDNGLQTLPVKPMLSVEWLWNRTLVFLADG